MGALKQYDYGWEEYIAAQIDANRRKRKSVWVSKDNIAFLADYLGPVNMIVCHGTRNGAEQRYFAECYPDARIVGTEISPEATSYDMTIHHDFHEPLGIHADLIYSNALDHAFDPIRALSTWMSEADRVVVEHSDCDFEDRVTPFDPFGASFDELYSMISLIGEVIDVLDLPVKHAGAKEQKAFVCRGRSPG